MVELASQKPPSSFIAVQADMKTDGMFANELINATGD
jgi:hypothetical protein